MDFKKFWKETFAGYILKNILIATGIIVALSWATLIAVDYYTHHGETETIPDLRGMYVEEAQVLLAKKGLYPQVIDSVYVRGKKLGTIISQTPTPNSLVKTNRPVYIVINSRNVHQITLPEINDMSFRQAEAMLKSMGIEIAHVEYAPSEFKDLVLQIKYKDMVLSPGARIPEGGSVVLVIGNGLSEGEDAIVPAIKGKSLTTATQLVESAGFTVGLVEYDVTPNGNETEYIIYRQRPAAGSSLPAGSRIDLFLSTDKSRMNEVFEEDKNQEETEEQFF